MTSSKTIAITLVLQCRADVPDDVVQWMADNLVQHAEHEFGDEPLQVSFSTYAGPPVEGVLDAHYHTLDNPPPPSAA